MNIVLFYSGYFFSLLFIVYSLTQDSKRARYLLSYLIVLYFSILIGFRGSYGYDTNNYITYFLNSESLEQVYFRILLSGEAVFYLYGWLIRQITDNTHFYLFSISFISLNIIFFSLKSLFKENSSYVLLAVFLLISTSTFYLYYGNTIRQGFAVAFVVGSFALFMKDKKGLGYLALITGGLIHLSAFIFVPIYYLVFNRKISINWTSILFMLSVVVGFIGIEKFLAVIPLPLLPDIVERLSRVSPGADNQRLKIVILIFNLLLFGYLYNYKKYDLYRISYKIYLLLAAFVFLFINAITLSERLIAYTVFFIPFLLIPCLNMFKQRSYSALFLIFISISYYIFVINHPSVIGNYGF